MAESSIEITEGTGTLLHAWSRTIASTTKYDQFSLPGEPPLATYTAFATVATNTANSHLMALQGDGTNFVRLRRLTIRQANIATASTLDIRVLRTTTAGSGGTAVNARPLDTVDTDPYGGSVQTLPTSKGTEGNQLLQFRLGIASANPLTNVVEWVAGERTKPIITGNGSADGVCIKNINSVATVVDIEAEFSLSAYL